MKTDKVPYTMAPQLMQYELFVYCLSDIGLVRLNNEDAYKLMPEYRFFILADGMGGHQAGEVASKEAVEQLCLLFQRHIYPDSISCAQAKEELTKLIQEVNRHVYRMGSQFLELRGMGTTLCCTFFHPTGLICGHVGDSRIYLFRNHQLSQLTRDHSLLQELIDLGQLNKQQAGEFLYKNIITKAIGTEIEVDPTVKQFDLEPEDMILLCTDGLTDMLKDEEIADILDHTPEEDIVKQLVGQAKQKGGYDNITVILVKVREKHETHLSGS
jgi:PPM family protein phosphatase